MSYTRGNRSVRAALHAAVAGFALLALAIMAPALPASAHSALISSNPSSDAQLDALPATIELQYNDNISDLGPTLLLRSNDETLAELEPTIKGQVMSAPAPTMDLGAGTYQLVWRVVSADGHPISGSIGFTIGDPQATATPSTDASEVTGAAAADEDESGSAGTWIALAVVPAVAVIALLLLRRRPTSKEDPS